MLLEAFQMSLSACLEHPGVPLLRSQMVGRLLAHATTPFLQSWISQQRQAVAAGATAAVGGPAGLMPVSASLSQAGGLQRMILRGHAAGITKILLSAAGVDVITGAMPHSQPHSQGFADLIVAQRGQDSSLRSNARIQYEVAVVAVSSSIK